MPTLDERKKRLQGVFDGPEVDEALAPLKNNLDEKPLDPTKSSVEGPTRETFGAEAPQGPRYTKPQLKEMYGSTAELLSDYFGDGQKKVEEQAKYHKRSARYDALGRAIGSLGDFVSADMGGPVQPLIPGRSREHMDRYEQLLLDYEEKKRADDLTVMQEMVRDKRMFADIMREQDMQAHQEEREDFKYERGEEDRRTERQRETEERRRHEQEMLPEQHKWWKKRTDYQDRLQREAETRKEALIARQAQVPTRGLPEEAEFNVRYGGRDLPVSGPHAYEILSRAPEDIVSSIFGPPFNRNFTNPDTKMRKLLAKSPKDMFVEVPVFDEQGEVVGSRLETSTRAKSPVKAKDMEQLVGDLFISIEGGTIDPHQVENTLIGFMDEEAGHRMSLPQAENYARAVAAAMYERPETDAQGNVVSHPLQDIPLPQGMKLPDDWPRGLERNFYNFLRYVRSKEGAQEGAAKRGAREKEGAAGTIPSMGPAGQWATGRTARGTTY